MKKLTLLLLITVFFTHCSTVRVFNTEAAPDIDASKYQTFGFYEVTAAGDTTSSTFYRRLEIVRSAIKTEMETRGYRYTTTNPDLLINMGIVVKQEIQTRQTNWQTDGRFTYMGQRNYSWKSEEVEVGRYKEGTLTLHIVETARNKMIWKGSIEGVVPEKPDSKHKAASQAMQKLFEQFPFKAG